MRGVTEHQLQQAIHVFLKRSLPDAVVYASDAATGQQLEPRIGALRKARGIVPGIPDHHVLVDGRALYFEIKLPNGKLSDQQRVMSANIKRAGGLWFEVRSVCDVADALASLQLRTQATRISAEMADLRLASMAPKKRKPKPQAGGADTWEGWVKRHDELLRSG